MENQPPSSKASEVDAPLQSIGFEIQELSPQRVSGHLPVTQKCCQVCPPFPPIHYYKSATHTLLLLFLLSGYWYKISTYVNLFVLLEILVKRFES